MNYPSSDEIIAYNAYVLLKIQAKKSDKAQVMSHSKISSIVEGCEKLEGDIYDKAAYLLKELIQKHPFASGNRRTAFIVMKSFLIDNHAKIAINDFPENAKTLQGIRERYYSDQEIREWIKNGKIRKFERI